MKKIQKIIFTLIYTFLVMTAGFAANYTWTGTQSTEWTDYRNWNKNGSPAGPGEKPTTGDDVEIPQTSTKPVITGYAISGSTLNLTINELTLKENAILTLVLKDRDVNFTCTNGITSEDVSTLGAEPGKIRVQHHSTSPGEGSGTKDLAWLVKPSGASGAKISLTEVSSSGYKTRTITLFNIDSVKDAVIEPSPWAADICVLKLDSDIKISGSLNNKGTTTYKGTFYANGKTVTFNGSSSAIEGTGDMSFHNLTVESGKSLTLKSNINISGTFTKNGEFQANDNTTVTFIGSDSKIAGTSVPTFWSLTIASGAKLTLEKDIKIAGTFTNNQNFAHGNKAVTFVGFGSEITGTATETEFSTLAIDKRELPAPPPYNKVTLADGKKIKIKVFKNIYKGTFNAGSGTEITVTEEFDNTDGTFEPKTSTVKLIPSGNTVTITGTGNAGDTAFNNLSLTNAGGKTLKINGKISVNGNLVLQGTNVGSLLTIAGGTGGPGIELNIDKSGGQYLDVKSNIPITGTQTYTTSQSRPENMTSPPANWIFDNCNNTDATPVKWTARASSGHETKWDNRDNWVPKGVPGINTYVKIPSVANSKYPKLESNTYAKAKKVTVEAGTEIDCDEYVISSVNTVPPAPQTNPCSLENYGTLKMKGTGLQNSWFTKITLKTDSTIEYYGTPPSAIDVWAGPYENLKVSGTRQNLRALSITVNKDFTVASPSFAQAAGTFIFNGSSTIGGTGTISFYNLTVASSKSVTLNKDIAVGGAFINNNGATFNANDKNITFGGNFTNDGAFTPGSNTVTFNGSSTIGGSGAISFNNLSVASGKSVTLNKDITVGGAFINSSGATFNASTYNITLNSIFSNSGTFNSTDGTNNSFTFNGSFTNSGTFNANPDNITFTGTTFTNSGTFAAGTNNTLTLNPPPGGTVTITGTGNAGNTKFHNLSLTGAGGKNLTINGKISVNGILKLEGTSAGSLLTIAGGTNSPGIKLSADQANGKWLNVHTNIPMIPESGGKTYTVTESKDHEVSGFFISDGHPKNWIFSSYAGPMAWKGNHSSNWSDWQNWRPYGIPGVKSDVTIPQKEAAAHYPKLTANVSAKSVTVNTEAELDLDGQIIKKGTGSNDFTPLTNNGTLKMTGTSSASDPKGQKEWFENATITFTDNSTVEYYGNTPATSNIWAGPYENLKVSGGKTSFTTGNLIVNKAFTVDTTGSFTVNADSQNYKGAVELKKETTFKSALPVGTIFENNLKTFGNSITFDGNGAIKTRDIMLALGSGTITVKEGTGGWTSAGQITVKDIIVKRNWISSSHITASGDITADNTAHTNIWTSSFGDIKLTGNLTAAQFNQTAGTLTFNGTGTPEQELKFTGAGNKNIKNLAINSSAKVKLGSNITIQGNFTNSGTFDATTAPGYTITLTNGADHTITGTGTASATTFRNLSLTGAGGKTLTITGNISVNGNLTLQGSGAADAQLLTIDGNASGSGIALSAANTAIGKYLKVRTNIHITTDSHKYQADSSKPYTVSGDPEIGINNPKNWIFDDCLIEMKWLGGSGTTDSEKTAWSAPKNWLPNGIPGIHTPVKIESGKTYYPKLTANVKAKTITLNGELDLDSYTISDDAGGTSRSHIDNKGKLKMTGTAGSPTDQKTWLEIPTSNIGDCITHNDSSIVEYYGSTNNNVWKGPYKNLSLDDRPNLKTDNENLIVSGALTVTGSGIHIKTGTGTQTYNGIITATEKDITLEGSTITTKHNITANNIKVLGDWNSNNGTITADTNIEAAKWNSEQGTITAGNDITVTGDWYSQRSNIRGRNITSSGSKWTSWGGITATGNINIEHELEFNGGSMAVGGNLTAEKLNTASTYEGGGSIIFNGSGTKTLSGKGGNNIEGGSIQNLQINSGTTLELESDITITVGLDNQGKFDAVTNSKKITLKHKTNTNKITIKGNTSAANTKFHNLECTNAGGKALTINGKITVAGNFDMSGTAWNDLLNIEGPGEITLGSNQTPGSGTPPQKGYYLNIHTNIPITGTYTYRVKESKPDGTEQEIYTDKKPENWIFDDCLIEMKWQGGSGTTDPEKKAWSEPKNWLPHGIPGIHTDVKIESGKTDYPKLTAHVKAKKITLNGELDLDSYIISDNDGGTSRSYIDNQGKLKMTGTANQKTWFEQASADDKITLGSNSTVQYDSGSSANVFSGPYENLILNRSITAASSLTVNKKTTVNAAATITAPAQTYGGDVRINANTTFSAINSITFSHAIGASANNVTFDGNGTINTQKLSAADITVNSGTGAWTSSGSVTADNINTQRDWISSDDVTAAGNITSNNAWTASSGNIALKGNLSANQFTQTGGTLIFNGNGTPQTLLFTNPAGQKNIYNLIIDTGATLELRSDITIKRDFTNKGTFNADTHTVTLTNDADHKIIGTNTAGDTKFYNLFCEDAGDKTLTFENEIWVEEKMYLSGSYSTGIKPLNIDGNGVISLNNNHPIPGNVSITNIRQKFLRVFSNKVKIGNNKYYGTDESTDDQGTTKNNNGWVFYKTFELVNSFAIPGKNEIYLLFKNGSANNVYTELTEADLANPNFTPLIITDGSSHVYAENRLYIPERLPLPSAIKEHTFWKFTLNNSISPDWILNQNALISLDYYDRKKQKLHISDIGIDMITPQRASNSIVLRSFDASEDDKALPRLDVTILAEKKGASNNAQLYFYSKDSAEHKLWHPGTVPIGPPPRFAVPQAGTTNYGCTLENNLLKSIISEQDVHLEPNKVGGFMYIYDGWLPCARLRNSNDILSFDVWHFKIVGVQKQKGGVSIFDNVLDPYKGQETIIAAHLQKPGMLTIQIMSIDGSIIRTIERSYKAAGDHIYFWDGKNNGGNPVARGIYFVRIAGPDIDEVRKILVVKN